MARLFSQTLIPHGRFLLRRSPAPATATASPGLVCFRRRFSSDPNFVEIDLDSTSSQSEARAEFIKRLNKMVQQIILHKSTPDWLPFIPGSSFWVPPSQHTASKIADLVDKVTSQLSEEEFLSLLSLRGWPSSEFFFPPVDDSASAEEVKADMEFNFGEDEVLEVKIELLSNSGDESKRGGGEK